MSKVLLQEKNERLLSKVENRLNWGFSPSFLLSLKIYIEKKIYKIKNLTIKIFVIFFLSFYLAAWLIHTIKENAGIECTLPPGWCTAASVYCRGWGVCLEWLRSIGLHLQSQSEVTASAVWWAVRESIRHQNKEIKIKKNKGTKNTVSKRFSIFNWIYHLQLYFINPVR